MSDVYVTFGGDSSELEASLASAKVAVSALTRELADLAREQAEAGAGVDSDIGQQMVDLGGKLSQAKEHAASLKRELVTVGEGKEGGEENVGVFEKLKETLEAALSPVASLKASLGELIELVAAAFAVEKIAEWAEGVTEAGEKIEKEAAKLGASFAQVQQLQAVAALSGENYDELAQHFERLQLSLARVGERATPAGEALKALGLNAAELRGLPIAQQFEEIAEAVSRFGDGPGKTAAVAALGKGFTELLPLLDKGKEGLKEFAEAAERADAITPDHMVAAFAATQETINELKLAVTGLLTEAFVPFNDVANGAARILADVIEGLSRSAQQGGLLNAVLGNIATTLRVVETALSFVVAGFDILVTSARFAIEATAQGFITLGALIRDVFVELGKAIPAFFSALVTAGKEAVSAVGQQFEDLGAGINATLHFNFGAAKSAFGEMGGDAAAAAGRIGAAFHGVFDFSGAESDFKAGMAKIGGLAKSAGVELKDANDGLVREVNAIWGLGGEKKEGGKDKPQVPGMDLGGGGRGKASQEASREVRAGYESEVQAAQEAAGETQKTLDGLLQRKRIETEEWLRLSLAALDKEQDAIQDAADKALASAALTASQKTELANREQRELATIAQKILEDQNKAAAAVQKQWDSAFASINGAVDGQINGLLRGTTSWATAFKNVLASLTEDVLKFFVNWGLKAAERFAQDGIMAAAGLALQKSTNAAAATSDAGKAAAGAYSATAGIPIIGPVIAPAAAAAAYAGTLAFASADIGMWNVPADQLAMVHKNELIMPAAESDAFRSMLSGAASGGGQSDGGGAGGDVHLHVHAIDGASVKSFFNSHRDHIVNTVREGMRGGSKGALQMAAGR